VKIKIERPDADAARDIFSKYLVASLPLADEVVKAARGDREEALTRIIDEAVQRMYSDAEENRFLEVTYANGDKEILYFKDFNSGAMIENIVSRAKKVAIKRFLETGHKGIVAADLFTAVTDEFKENEDLPNTTNPDDWARISGKKGERIVYVRTLIEGGSSKDLGRTIEQINTGQYL
jgi:proteasome-associated ATPase